MPYRSRRRDNNLSEHPIAPQYRWAAVNAIKINPQPIILLRVTFPISSDNILLEGRRITAGLRSDSIRRILRKLRRKRAKPPRNGYSFRPVGGILRATRRPYRFDPLVRRVGKRWKGLIRGEGNLSPFSVERKISFPRVLGVASPWKYRVGTI